LRRPLANTKGKLKMERSSEWRWIRQCLAASLYAEGPLLESAVRAGARQKKWTKADLNSAAASLGVVQFYTNGQWYWRLPEGVVPFVSLRRLWDQSVDQQGTAA
jgi:hypothetical protein